MFFASTEQCLFISHCTPVLIFFDHRWVTCSLVKNFVKKYVTPLLLNYVEHTACSLDLSSWIYNQWASERAIVIELPRMVLMSTVMDQDKNICFREYLRILQTATLQMWKQHERSRLHGVELSHSSLSFSVHSAALGRDEMWSGSWFLLCGRDSIEEEGKGPCMPWHDNMLHWNFLLDDELIYGSCVSLYLLLLALLYT